NNNGVARVVSGNMTVLRHHNPQYRQQFGGADILQLDNLGNVSVTALVGGNPIARDRQRAGIAIRYNTHHTAGFYRGKTMHIKNREKQGVEFAAIDGLIGNDLYLTAYLGVDNNGFTGGLGNKLDNLLNIGV